jgi:hypothetical protein
MAEHLIRLRGGWELRGKAVNLPSRLTLPLGRFPGLPPALGLRLFRSFQPPSLDRNREQLWLRLEAVPGLTLVKLDGRTLDRPDAGAPIEHLRLDADGPLPARSELMLRVSFCFKRLDQPWGQITLVIRSS